MPRGGHRGGLFPISGLPWGLNRMHLKRGLYNRKRAHIFVPRWGTRCSPGVAAASASASAAAEGGGGEEGERGGKGRRRLQGGNTSPLPDGSTRVWEEAAHKAWPLRGGTSLHVGIYAQNEARFLLPAARCTAGAAVTEYILEQLEPSAAGKHRTFSGIGRPDVLLPLSHGPQMKTLQSSSFQGFVPLHLLEVYRSVMKGSSSSSRTGSSSSSPFAAAATAVGDQALPEGAAMQQRGRIKRLWDLVCSSDSWRDRPEQRSSRGSQRGGAAAAAVNAFPFVDEQAALVRDLPLPEILYSRHNHRLQSRRHPFWIDMHYKRDKSKRPYIYRRRVAKQEAQTKTFGLSRALGAF